MYLEKIKNNLSRRKITYLEQIMYTDGTNIMISKYELKSRINSYMSEINHVYSWT